MSAEWAEWFRRIPQQPTKQEQYTATMLKALHTLVESATFRWALTGGTALQSYFPVARRRYSTDIEIVTTERRAPIERWLAKQGFPNRAVSRTILVARLTPEGQLFIIHDYPAHDLSAAGPESRAFDHFPFVHDPPPGQLRVPMLSRTFLAATKIYGIQQDDRGGERSKDANDLVIALPDEDMAAVRAALEAYARHRRHQGDVVGIARRAGVWLRIFASTGNKEFVRWHSRFAAPGTNPPTKHEFEVATLRIEALVGAPIVASPLEARRGLLHAVSIKEAAKVAKAAGYRGKQSSELEKLFDFLGANVLPRLDGPPPSTPAELVAEMRRVVGLD